MKERIPIMAVPDKDFIIFTDVHIQARRKWGGERYWVDLAMSAIDTAAQVSLQKDGAPIIFIGDLFHQKDRHPAGLINMVREHIHKSAEAGTEWFILEGNHDIGSRGDTILHVLGHKNVHIIT